MVEKVCAECKQPADLKCSACKLVAYCSKEHQKQHWKQHKSLCRAYEVKKIVRESDLNLRPLRLQRNASLFGRTLEVVGSNPSAINFFFASTPYKNNSRSKAMKNWVNFW